LRSLLARLVEQEDLNFLLTNRIPRRLATSFVGWFSRIEQPIVRDLSIRVWRLFCDLDLSEAKQTHFKSLRDCFIWLTRFRWRQRIGHFADGRRVSDTVSLSAIAPQDRATVRSIGREIVGISRKLRFLGSLG